jgi:hypothetical protein
MSNTDVNSFLFEGGAKSFQWGETPGTICRGTIESAEMRQQTSLEDNKPLFWDDGRPRMMLVITLQTAEHDGDDDDGKRTIYAKGGRFEVADGEGTSMRDAIAQAVKDAGASSIEPGDELAVGFTGRGKAKRGYTAPKLYAASFKKAAASVSASDLFGDGNAAVGDPF